MQYWFRVLWVCLLVAAIGCLASCSVPASQPDATPGSSSVSPEKTPGSSPDASATSAPTPSPSPQSTSETQPDAEALASFVGMAAQSAYLRFYSGFSETEIPEPAFVWDFIASYRLWQIETGAVPAESSPEPDTSEEASSFIPVSLRQTKGLLSAGVRVEPSVVSYGARMVPGIQLVERDGLHIAAGSFRALYVGQENGGALGQPMLSSAAASALCSAIFDGMKLPDFPSLAAFAGFIEPASEGWCLTARRCDADTIVFTMNSCVLMENRDYRVYGSAACLNYTLPLVSALVRFSPENEVPFSLLALDSGEMPGEAQMPDTGDVVETFDVCLVDTADRGLNTFSIQPMLRVRTEEGAVTLERAGDRRTVQASEDFFAYVPPVGEDGLIRDWDLLTRVDARGLIDFLDVFESGYGDQYPACFQLQTDGGTLLSAYFVLVS